MIKEIILQASFGTVLICFIIAFVLLISIFSNKFTKNMSNVFFSLLVIVFATQPTTQISLYALGIISIVYLLVCYIVSERYRETVLKVYFSILAMYFLGEAGKAWLKVAQISMNLYMEWIDCLQI